MIRNHHVSPPASLPSFFFFFQRELCNRDPNPPILYHHPSKPGGHTSWTNLALSLRTTVSPPALYTFSQLSSRNTPVRMSPPDLDICWPDSNTHTHSHPRTPSLTHTQTFRLGCGSSSTTPCKTTKLPKNVPDSSKELFILLIDGNIIIIIFILLRMRVFFF